MRKKLPKAISQTIDDLRRTKPNLRDESKSTRVSLVSIPSPVPGGRAGDVLAEEVRNRLASIDPSSASGVRQPKRLVVVSPPKAEARPVKTDVSAAARADAARKPKKPAASDKPLPDFPYKPK